jgi:hypothetical protein
LEKLEKFNNDGIVKAENKRKCHAGEPCPVEKQGRFSI